MLATGTTQSDTCANGLTTMDVAQIVNDINKWLHTVGVDCSDQRSFVDAYSLELRAKGLPVDRVYVSTIVLHPLVASRAWKWEGSSNISEFTWSRAEYRDFYEDPAIIEFWKKTKAPMYQIMMGADFVSIKNQTEDDVPKLSPNCEWMITDKYTELYGLPAPGPNRGNKSGGSPWSLQSMLKGRMEGGYTWSTKTSGGFTPEQIQVFNETVFALTTVMRLHISRFTSQSLLMAYLGEDAGNRVYRGEIERGEGLTIRSVVWFSDVRGFTKMSSELDRNELIDVINQVFEITSGVVQKHKGQVLKFMGDGCMCIFNTSSVAFQRDSLSENEKRDLDQDHGAKVCHRARLAAIEVQERLNGFRREREAQRLRGASVGIGLHYGDVAYGNVGAPQRLDFTVMGPSVNLASRVESLCSSLQAKVLATDRFVQLDLDADVGHVWKSRGGHQVKGVADAVTVYELNE